jgi:pimeloyl-ACP methyl ester carboxylesterase
MPLIDIAGQRIEVETIGGASGRPALLLLHEGLGSVALWRDFPKKLAAATGCTVATYSRAGYGRSGARQEPYRTDYMHREALQTLPRLIAALGLGAPVLVGHSDGASIAIIHAGAGHRVRGLILEAPHVFVEQISLDAIAAAKKAYETGDLKQRLARYHGDVESAFRGWNDAWLAPEFRAWNIEASLPGISCPVQVIQGSADPYGSLAHADAIARGVRGPCERVVLACGHAPHREAAAATLASMTEFIGRL